MEQTVEVSVHDNNQSKLSLFTASCVMQKDIHFL